MPQGKKKGSLELNVYRTKNRELPEFGMVKGREAVEKPKPNQEIQVLHMHIKRTAFHWGSFFHTRIHIN